ncbi:MAG: EpsG family protein [Weeksellaceae bacterium]
MFPYLIIFLIAAILFYSLPQKRSGLVTVYLMVFIGLVGFRDMIGGFDVYIYSEVYEVLIGKDLFTYPYFEKGYLVYYYILQLISERREFMFFVTAVIMTLLHFKSIKKHSPHLGMSLFIYFCKFFLFSFVYLRQGLAMGIIWLSISFLINKKYWYVALFATLAFMFHKSSMIFIPFLFIAHRKFNNLQLGFIAFLIIFISLTPLGDMLLGFIGDVSESQKFSAYASRSGGVNIFYLLEGGIGIYLAILFQKYFYHNRNTTVIFNGFFMYSLTILAGLTNATFIRFSWYYFIFVVLALPYIYYFYRYQNYAFKPLFKNLLFIYYAMVFFRLLILYDGGDFMPYKSIFQDFDRGGMWEFMEYRKDYLK